MGRSIIDANLYMVLGTADSVGRPWTTPVYYAFEAYRKFFWVSSPEAQHSRNINVRSEASIVVFDSTAPIGTGVGVYMSVVAGEITGKNRQGTIATFSRRSLSHSGHPWRLEDVAPPASLRLYGATAVDQYVLGPGDKRTHVTL